MSDRPAQRPGAPQPSPFPPTRSDMEVLRQLAQHRFAEDLSPRQQIVFVAAKQKLFTYTEVCFWLGGVLAPLPLLRGRYAIRNLRNLPPLVTSGRPNRAAIADRLWFFGRSFIVGSLGAGCGGSLGFYLGKSQYSRMIEEAGAGEAVKESLARLQRDWAEVRKDAPLATGQAEAIYGPSREWARGMKEGTFQGGEGESAPAEGSSSAGVDSGFVPDESYYERQTVDDSSFEANQDSSRPSASRSTAQSGSDATPSRWEQVRKERGPQASTWDRIRQERGPQRSSQPTASSTTSPSSSSSDRFSRPSPPTSGTDLSGSPNPNPNEDKERERKEFEALLDRERRMGEEGFVDDGKQGKW